jgi:hypothetical protein
MPISIGAGARARSEILHPEGWAALPAAVDQVGAQTSNKSLKLLSAPLHLAKDENTIANVPKITSSRER